MTDSNGLMSAVKRLMNTMIGIVQTRLELFSNDIEHEKVRIERKLFYGSIFLLFFGLFLTFLTIFILVLFWDNYRFQVLAGFVTGYLIAGAWAMEQFRRVSREGSRLFSGSLNELRNDRKQLSPPQ